MEFLKIYLDPLVFSILGFMALLVVYFSIERFIFFTRLQFEKYTDVKELEEDVSKNLTLLYIVYSNAPYVGLLGTVVGIMIVFYDMGGSGNIDVKSITLGLSMALKATALGLVVAIPTLMIYNAFLRVADTKVNRFKILNKKHAD
ncbi:TonB-system energizer ExbB [Helicobacter bilis]|uniref:TonB-system energizer ExbB n=1 Tax=Helicobacter bilis TaxID=37372 RepID=A0A4V6I5I1_9HELI|nr:TonB-system energizer ExbB [Helicobacter bilis]MCI7410740.1 TonB-system energizer ExbB [Helicobacter bilis]MDD7296982.1 TonB-system energizer ExbB [Helicobacter bilis]MDY4399867.1 TonB-system energizer ExbB [Helicobacter bilis]TLE06972.1 TonB-system energizer ExbB [Helicobacter bilis]TLE07944.1 TonB-system energizer ExbB [Helicobacter bilis]